MAEAQANDRYHARRELAPVPPPRMPCAARLAAMPDGFFQVVDELVAKFLWHEQREASTKRHAGSEDPASTRRHRRRPTVVGTFCHIRCDSARSRNIVSRPSAVSS